MQVTFTPSNYYIVTTSTNKSLWSRKASGPDGISKWVLKELADQTAMPLSLLFNQSIEDGKIPADWKEAYVSPVPKSGDLTILQL